MIGYNSSGGYLPDATFGNPGPISYNLGYWNSGFTATATNSADWLSNWNLFSTAIANNPADPGDPLTGTWLSFSENLGGASTFNGQQLYLWASGDGQTGLFTDSEWQLPGLGVDLDPLDFNYTFDINSSAIVGALGGNVADMGELLPSLIPV